ncbi:MAG: hypothetical protein P8Z49_07565 [Acidobacteriota bacterium]|jgi:hypothetical protein
MRRLLGVCALLAAAGLIGVSMQAQVVRESGAGSVAGVLHKLSDFTIEYTIKADGNQLLIADLDAELFRTTGGCGEEHAETATTTATESEESCGCDETDAGPHGFYIEIYKDGLMVGSAGRPTRPGWERDPRVACLLEEEGVYAIRIRFVPRGENAPQKVPFLMNVTLRGLAPGGTNLMDALAASKNQMEVKPVKTAE